MAKLGKCYVPFLGDTPENHVIVSGVQILLPTSQAAEETRKNICKNMESNPELLAL